MKVDPPIEVLAIALFAAASEVDDGTDRDTRAVDCASGIMQADVVDLRAQRQVGQNADINAAANAKREVGIVAVAVPSQMPGTRQELNEWSDAGRVVHDKARAKHKRIGVQGDAAWRTVVAAEIADNAEVGDGLVREGTADAILAEAAAAAEVEVGVAGGGVERLGVRRNGKEEQRQTK
jgi:hypothetical protein